ncbi:aminomethyl-transferring glycine dehydrogenase subunit GcvPA [Priestia filamentosa]|uniref:Probable glycine dehydrogenase (decarboxylating) subunit 1 n=1 Tax=Priestia filamentosa TaxID=1402861 RepID=A0A1X7CZD7_9BACI|nr:aminomethyl-transferring glycine dehydrogenase subunit GcvPA [Priestia filamentosa]AKO94115.1 glycine dehydrogenase (aminomethyl-transferring) [Priestia filamentosa]MDT3764376.1 aminomethyl-transferring glycine dehydrogenase subunit GcvPA [Priestia filamentosa]OXS71165.1 glycine dehydrogenase (aminomethyl-transferring) [Priestia filamentosa]RJS66801.1 aminomethyl-transferring glycine dehydrogenase [Priestia filamentosa]WCM14996.1 aminomethyl-transferring glycine dehydrogenase subunit GcvPA 
MTHHYLPMTEEDRREMLAAIGVSTVDELFEDIPESVRFKREYKLKKRASEACLTRELYALSAQNASTKQYASFLGAGVYDHYIPSVVDHIISRSEFYTAYTPYQPEISQGELQAIFEFQTMICELTGMDVANSSMYDGGTALAEAAMVSAGHTKKRKILVSSAVHPESREVLKTYAKGQNLAVVEIPHKDGLTNLRVLEEEMDEDVGSVILQYPNFFGQVEPLKEIEKIAHKQNALFVVSSNPLSLGVLAPPGEFGADIVVGDAQPFGIPMQFGGPHCGYFATSKKLMRKIPGRLVGQTKDNDGKRGFVLTLQAREQHIRRDKATSNICSNQALNALAASVAMTSLGKSGVKEMAKQNMSKAHYAKKAFEEAGFDVWFSNAFFNEFVVSFNCSIQKLNASLLKKGIIGGYDLGRDDISLQGCMLIAVTEIRSKDEIDKFVEEVREFHHEN